MATEREDILKPTFRRQRAGIQGMDNGEDQREAERTEADEAVMERTYRRPGAGQTSQRGNESAGAGNMGRGTQTAQAGGRKPGSGEEAEVKAEESAGEYEKYITNLGIYKENLKKEIQDAEKLTKARDIRDQYVRQWDAAMKNAESSWSRSVSDTLRRAGEERNQLRQKAEEEKQGRKRAADQKEQNIKKQQQQVAAKEQQLHEAEQQINKKLSEAKSYVLQGYDLNPGLKSFMQGAVERKYLSKKQTEMAGEPVETFCMKWVPDVGQLKSMESALLSTDFVNRINRFSVDDVFYKSFTFGVTGIALVVFFLIMLLAYGTKWGFFLFLGGGSLQHGCSWCPVSGAVHCGKIY